MNWFLCHTVEQVMSLLLGSYSGTKIMLFQTAGNRRDKLSRSHHEENSIHCAINDEYLSTSLAGQYAIRLQVMAEDYRRVAELFIKGGSAKCTDFDFENY
jgi:hypothetical protein